MHACKGNKTFTAMLDFYGISYLYDMHENNMKINNSFWSHFSKI